MNKIGILCIFVICLALAQAIPRNSWRRRGHDRYPRPGPSRYCWNNGRRVYPGESYYDGCNWCRCGRNGMSACTLRACPDQHGWPRPRPRPRPFRY